MNFRPFEWPDRIGNYYVPLPSAEYPYYDQLLTEAQADGFDLAESSPFGVTTAAKRDNGTLIHIVVIGPQFFIGERTITVGPALILRHQDGTAFFSVTSWHTIMRIPGNPIELHAKWTPAAGEHRAVLNVQAIEHPRQLDAIPEMLALLQTLKVGGGRPRNEAYQRAAARLINGECKTNREAFNLLFAEMEESDEKNYIRNTPGEYSREFEKFKQAMKYHKKARYHKARR